MYFRCLDFTFILTFTQPTFTYANARKKNLAMYIFRQNTFNTFLRCCINSVLYSTICHLLHNFISLCSNNTIFINHVLKFKYQPRCVQRLNTQSVTVLISIQILWAKYTVTILPAYTTHEDGTDSFPKCQHIKFRCRGITRKKEYNIQNTVKVGNHELRNLKMFPNGYWILLIRY
jgi:hypothetical protein